MIYCKVFFIILTSPCAWITSALKVNDFLNSEYLPSTLLLEEAAVDSASDDVPFFNITADGDIRDAFATMQYHRSMINEYLCRSYVADEILSEIGPNKIQRLGVPAKKYRNHKATDELLKDQGSSTYRDWLSRSTLLDDIYRHYDQMGDGDGTGDPSGGMEAGEVTGYAVQGGGSSNQVPSSSYGPPGYGPPGGGPVGPEVHFGGGPSFGQGSIYGNQFVGHGHVDYQQGGGERGDDHQFYDIEEQHSGKGLALKDLFDLALTALAFLAFGLFIMTLIMNCMVGNQGTTIIMQTTMTTSTAEGTTASGTRVRRSPEEDQHLNEMAYRVLTSIDKFMEINQARSSSESCLQYSLCRNNKYSRALNTKYRIWLPVWSFGLSWIVGRLGEDRLGSLQASVLGLGDADCAKIYPTCSLKRQ